MLKLNSDRDQRVLEARHDDDVVDEVVLGPAQAMQAVTQPANLVITAFVDEQHLEVRPLALVVARVAIVIVIFFAVLGEAQIDVTRAVDAAGQRPHHAGNDVRELAEILLLEQMPQKPEILVRGEGAVALEGIQQPHGFLCLSCQRAHVGLAHVFFREPTGVFLEPVPGIETELSRTVVEVQVGPRFSSGRRPGVGHDISPYRCRSYLNRPRRRRFKI